MTVEAAPRGPRGHLLLGSGPDLARDQLGFYAACAREYGDVVPLRLGPNRGLLVYHPDAIEEVLVARSRDFIKMEAVLLLATIAQRFRLTMEPGQRVTPTPYITLRPEPGLRMRLERR
jgi:cytochrome P450